MEMVLSILLRHIGRLLNLKSNFSKSPNTERCPTKSERRLHFPFGFNTTGFTIDFLNLTHKILSQNSKFLLTSNIRFNFFLIDLRSLDVHTDLD